MMHIWERKSWPNFTWDKNALTRPLARDQVRSSIARRLGMDAGGLVPADRDVEGIVEVMLDATGH